MSLLEVLATVAVVACIAFGCSYNTLDHGFAYDDISAIVNNKDVTSGDHHDIWHNDFWGHPVKDTSSHKSFRPLTTLSFRANHWYAPSSYHTVNVIIHTCVCVMFTCMIITMTNMCTTSGLLSGVLFAVHPVHVDAVASVVGRAELLSALLVVCALMCWYRTTLEASVWWLVAAMTMASAALVCKETGFTVVGVMCVASTLLHDRSQKRLADLLAQLTIMVVVSGIVLTLRHWHTVASRPYIHPDYNYVYTHNVTWSRRLTIPYLHAIHYGHLIGVVPTLAPDYSFYSIPMIESLSDTRNLATLLTYSTLFLLLPVTIYRHRHDHHHRHYYRLLVVGWALLVIPFVPVSNVLFMCGFEVAERVMYLPSLGFCMLVGIAPFIFIPTHWPRHAFVVLLLAMVPSMAWRTWQHNEHWRDDLHLWRATVTALPENAKAHFNYGNELMKLAEASVDVPLESLPEPVASGGRARELIDEALVHFRRAHQILPNHFLYDIGLALYKLQDVHGAEATFHRALDAHQQYPHSADYSYFGYGRVPNIAKVYGGLAALNVHKFHRLHQQYPRTVSVEIVRNMSQYLHAAKDHFTRALETEVDSAMRHLILLVRHDASLLRAHASYLGGNNSETLYVPRTKPPPPPPSSTTLSKNCRRVLRRGERLSRTNVWEAAKHWHEAMIPECTSYVELWHAGMISMSTAVQRGNGTHIILPLLIQWLERAVRAHPSRVEFSLALAQYYALTNAPRLALHCALDTVLYVYDNYHQQQQQEYWQQLTNGLKLLTHSFKELRYTLHARRTLSILALIDTYLQNKIAPLKQRIHILSQVKFK